MAIPGLDIKHLAANSMTTFAPVFHRCVVGMPITDENDISVENRFTIPSK